MDKLIDFFYTIYSDGTADYYGVAVEDGKTVEWWAWEDDDGNGHGSDNYFEQSTKYGDPRVIKIDVEDSDAAQVAFDERLQETYQLAYAKAAEMRMAASKSRYNRIFEGQYVDTVFDYLIADQETKEKALDRLHEMMRERRSYIEEVYSEDADHFFLSLFGQAVARAVDWQREHGIEVSAVDTYERLLDATHGYWNNY